MNGKKVSSPRIIVREGEAGSITQESLTEKTFVEVIAKESSMPNHKGILMDFVVGYFEKGERRIVSKPQILAQENEAATINVGDSSGRNLLLSVKAQRKTL